ncbi:hypothetical protein FAVG1_07210 [Fusarium avenaceum]|nr:hypothetical protein FAVG1_07210 [Fusarium avenaceum]
MSHYVYDYGASGYQHSQPYAYPTSQTYTEPPSSQNETAKSHAYSQGVEAYEYNQTSIPGLGMGFSHNSTSWQPTSPQSFPAIQSDPHGAAADGQMIGFGEKSVPGSFLSHGQRPDLEKAADTMEEGELSEGELEDIYEPDETVAGGIGRYDAQPSGSMLHLSHQDHSSRLPIGLQSGHNANERVGNSKQPGRDRSGSYSPYLSPREMQSNEISHAQSPPGGIDPPTEEAAVLAKSIYPSDSNDSSSRKIMKRDADAIFSESKRKAQEAILRLWPLNIRYHNFVEEGIDRSLLDELFTELGLGLETTIASQEQPDTSTVSTSAAALSNARNAAVPSASSDIAIVPTKTTDQAKDKAEERKDRIARLLAAKGSKTTPVEADENKSATPVSILTSNTKPEKTAAQSEKSKLIQRKMEALMKAREANAKATPQVPTSQEPQLSQPAPENSRSPSLPPAVSTSVNEQQDTALENADPAAAPPIPGLFLSSSAPSPTPNQRKRPVAADLNENSTPASQKRPFGQTRESRPFLIDVSDDEDDAEMDIDPPELHSFATQRDPTPGSRTASFREYPTLSDSASRHAVSSPKTVGTPTSSANGMYNLESMNKKIEEMKRRIAEAEARKKAKQSGNNSPLPQSEPQSKEGSVDASVPSPLATRAVSTTATEVQNGSASNASQPSSPYLGAKLPKIRGQPQLARPSLRARVASERLPILEARLRKQAEQLKHYESEVARIKLEMENSLAEEERLRKDAIQIEPAAQMEDESEPDTVQRKTSDLESPVNTSPREPVPDHTLNASTDNHKVTISYHGVEQDALMDESSSTGSTDDQETSEHYQDASQSHEKYRMGEGKIVDGHSSWTTQPPLVHDTIDAAGETAVDDVEDSDEDVAMEEADTSSEEEDVEEDVAEEADSDDYEPTDAVVDLPDTESPFSRQSSPRQAPVDNTVLETSDTDLQGLSMTTPITQPFSTGDGDTDSESNREVEIPKTSQVSDGPETTFVPYQTPLQYFRSYRFHPQYNNSVAGGLRSLTYSNKIDVSREVCPDQLTQGVCSKGSECHFQHFENMQVPDFRNQKVKDFEAISKGIIEYRASFLGDKTKILPLGGVTL